MASAANQTYTGADGQTYHQGGGLVGTMTTPQAPVATNATATGQASTKAQTITPTVISDTNIRDNVIPGIQNQAAKMLDYNKNPLYLRPGETPAAYNARVAGMQPQQGTDSPTGASGATSDSHSNDYDSLYQSIMGTTPQKDNFYDSDLQLLQNMQQTSDAKTSNQLAGINSQFQQGRQDLQAQQQTGNQQANQLLNRTGANRSGSGSQLISATSRGYARALGTLDLQENQAQNEALAAQADNDYKLLGEKLDVLKDKRQEKLDTVNKLYDNIVAEKKQKQQDIQNVVSSAAQGGAPKDIIDAISAAPDANSAIAAAGPYLQQGSGQLGDYIEYKKDAIQKGLTPEDYGAWKDQDDAKQDARDVSKAYSTAYASKAGAAAADAAANASAGNYNGDFAATISLASNVPGASNAQRAQTESDLKTFIGNEDYPSAYAQILSSTAAKLKGTAATTFQNQQQSLTAVDDMATSLQALHDAGYDTNKLKGGADKIGTTLGVLAVDPKYAAAATAAYTAFQQYRQNMTGAAFGAKESAEYASVLPNPSNTFELNLAKIAGAKEYLNGQVEGAIKHNIGQGGVEIKKYAEGASNAPADPKTTVDTYVSQHPAEAGMISSLYKVPGATDQDVLDYINQFQTK